MKDIFGDKLDKAFKYNITTPESGIFYNDGKGSFTFEPLPWDAQIAPVRGIAATHLDEDGQIDLVLAQNFYDNQRETGRMNGGLSLALLRKPNGNFLPLKSYVSGLSLKGNARSLTTPDLNNDGRPDLCFYHNNDKPRFFINRASGNFVKVDLSGHTKNPTGVGSRIQFIYSDGSKSVTETKAGSGYLSQNPPSIHHCIPKGKRLKSIKVTWPNGSESTADHTQGSRFIKISAE